MSVGLPLGSSAGAAAVVERLAAREQQLAAEREQRQAQVQAEADTREDVKDFLVGYKRGYDQLQQRYAAIASQASAAQQDGALKAALLEQLEDLSVTVNSKEGEVSAAAYFLPPYDLRSCTSQLQQLRVQLADTKQQLQPKRKFAFSKAVARTNISSVAAASAAQQRAAEAAAASTSDTSTAAAEAAAAAEGPASGAPGRPSTGPPALSVQDQQLVASGHGFTGLTGQLLVVPAQQLAGAGFVLHNLSGCNVFLLGTLVALRLQHLQDCRVYTGPVMGATFVDSCSSSTFMLASYQVRIHNADHCQFYLRVRSRPIIEHSNNLVFAPYAAEMLLSQQAATGPQQQQQLQQQQLANWQPAELLAAAQLSHDSGLWQQVDDFGWVKATASPHWCALPEPDRQAPPDRLPDMPPA